MSHMMLMHPAAAAWVAAWEGDMALAWAMAGHRRLGAGAPAGALSDELLRRIAEAALGPL
jgi:hypothetical protein